MRFQSFEGPTPTSSPAKGIALVLALTLMTACVVSNGEQNSPDDSEAGQSGQEDSEESPGGNHPSEDPIAQSITSSTKIGADFRVDILSLSPQGSDFLVLTFSMVNLSGSEDVAALKPPKDEDNPSDFQSLTLVDTANQVKHLPLFYTNGECYCGEWHDTSLTANERITTWLAFPAPPDSVDSMALLTAVTPPILDIPISNESAEHAPSEEVANPRTWKLHSFSEEVDGTKSREETPEQMAVSLSSDILFELNESSLTQDADQILEQVAKEIEGSSTRNVSIDGYTDNTGNDSVNIPLSEDRAETTKDRLSNLISDPQITYKVAGHGSSDPIASNETDDGRAKNRRVTVTFRK